MNDLKIALELFEKVSPDYHWIAIFFVILFVGIKVFNKNIYPKYKITIFKTEYYNLLSAFTLVMLQVVGIIIFYVLSLKIVVDIALQLEKNFLCSEITEADANIIIFVLFVVVLVFTSLIYGCLYIVAYKYIYNKMERKKYLLKENLICALVVYWGMTIFILVNAIWFDNSINENWCVCAIIVVVLYQMERNIVKEQIRDILYVIYTSDGNKYKTKEKPIFIKKWIYIKLYDKKQTLKEIVQIRENMVVKINHKVENKNEQTINGKE